MTKNAGPDKYSQFGYDIGFDTHRNLLLSDGSGFGKNVIIFRVDNKSSVLIDKTKKSILIFGKGPKDGLGDATLTAEAIYQQQKNMNNKKYV